VNVRSLLLALAFATLGLSQAACSSLSRPDEISIKAEPAKKPAAAPAAPQPGAAQAAAAAPAAPVVAAG
jgi:hypothetical protein